jgi:DNA-directed RNA polymerase specialized sigma subunit
MNNVDQLIRDHKKLIEFEASRYAKFVPLSVVLVEAYKLARKSAESYNPKTGVKFSTYLTNNLKKLSRISTQFGGVVRMPENKQFKVQKINQAEQSLRDELGRDPNVSELASVTGFSNQTVANLLKTRKKEVNINNLAYTPVFVENDNDECVVFVYHDLTDRDKYIFEHKTGFARKKVMSNEEIAKALNISPSTVANRVKLISDKLSECWRQNVN